ncbi:hypothetical protein TNIN_381471 [Trichonephila inaurata madagascariensis]|uniref:Uncharacterized protein n=1 Tax=Trichonephila inaurata madagascariensis TaxID=2747483 RepID=A0A8X6IV24_9ARAC|nr:hypothetical protein TNIN_381471 [Trichonephila inaurata madagascariensis]
MFLDNSATPNLIGRFEARKILSISNQKINFWLSLQLGLSASESPSHHPSDTHTQFFFPNSYLQKNTTGRKERYSSASKGGELPETCLWWMTAASLRNYEVG